MKTSEQANAIRRFSENLPVQLEEVFAAARDNSPEAWLPEFQSWRTHARLAPELAIDPDRLRGVAIVLSGLAISRIGITISERSPKCLRQTDIDLFDRGGARLVLEVLAELINIIRRYDEQVASEMSEVAVERLGAVVRATSTAEWNTLYGR